jgi:hypothetical protein
MSVATTLLRQKNTAINESQQKSTPTKMIAMAGGGAHHSFNRAIFCGIMQELEGAGDILRHVGRRAGL